MKSLFYRNKIFPEVWNSLWVSYGIYGGGGGTTQDTGTGNCFLVDEMQS